MRSKRSHKRVDYKEISSDEPASEERHVPNFTASHIHSDPNGKKHGTAGSKVSRKPANVKIEAPKNRSSPEIELSDFKSDNRKTGFMDLPVEIRLSIYKLVLVTRDCVDFGRRVNCAHSSAFLSVNRTICQEAAPILYGMNKFILRPCSSLSGSFWEAQWKWIGYGIVRRFLEMIGPINLSLLRQMFLKLDDATPSDEPKAMLEHRRFQYNEDLSRSLELLAEHATGLEVLKLGFSGRQKFRKEDSIATHNFSNILIKLKTDIVLFEDLYINYYGGKASNNFDVWPCADGTGNWKHHPRDNKIDGRNQKFLKENIVRQEPSNPRVITAFMKAEEEGNALKKKRMSERGHLYCY